MSPLASIDLGFQHLVLADRVGGEDRPPLPEAQRQHVVPVGRLESVLDGAGRASSRCSGPKDGTGQRPKSPAAGRSIARSRVPPFVSRGFLRRMGGKNLDQEGRGVNRTWQPRPEPITLGGNPRNQAGSRTRRLASQAAVSKQGQVRRRPGTSPCVETAFKGFWSKIFSTDDRRRRHRFASVGAHAQNSISSTGVDLDYRGGPERRRMRPSRPRPEGRRPYRRTAPAGGLAVWTHRRHCRVRGSRRPGGGERTRRQDHPLLRAAGTTRQAGSRRRVCWARCGSRRSV